MNVVLDLGKYHTLAFIKNWLSIAEFGNLDSAYCSKLHRQTLTSYISDSLCLTGNINVYLFPDFIYWLNVRHVSVDSMSASNKTLQLMTINKIILNNLFELRFNNCVQENALIFTKLTEYLLNLRRICLTCCVCLNDEFMRSIASNCPNLFDFDFSSSFIADKVLITLCKYRKDIKSLNISDCKLITDEAVIYLSKQCASSLTSLDISNNRSLTDKCMKCVSDKCSLLSSLSCIGITGITSSGIESFVVRNNGIITSLSISMAQNTTLFAIASHGANLTHLGLNGSIMVDDDGLDFICTGCRGLVSINLRGVRRITSRSVANIARHLVCLKKIQFTLSSIVAQQRACVLLCSKFGAVVHLDFVAACVAGRPLSGDQHALVDFDRLCTMNDTALLSLLPKFVSLDCLRLPAHHFSRNTVNNIAISCVSVLTLDLSSALGRCEDMLLAFATHCHMLEDVNLGTGAAGEFSDVGVIALVSNNRRLRRLVVKFGKLVTDLSVFAISKHCRSLQQLDLEFCQQITDAGVIHLAEGCPQLTRLCLDHCKLVTQPALEVLVDRCRCLERLSLKHTHLDAVWLDSLKDCGVTI